MDERKEILRQRVMEITSRREHTDDTMLTEIIDQVLLAEGRALHLTLRERLYYREALFNSFRRLDILQELLDDDEVTEIMVNGCSDIYAERKGKLVRWDKSFPDNGLLEDIVQQIVGRVNRAVNMYSPIVDARLEDGSRVNVVLPPIALNGPILTIRKFPSPLPMPRLIELGTITKEAAGFLERLVRTGYNIFISGGTSSGKSTFLNALADLIPREERLVIIEDSAELKIDSSRNVVRLEARGMNGEGGREVSISDLVRTSLRLRPDRIIIGEVRGKEVLDLMSALNTGHDGSLSSGHGNSSKDMLARLEMMALMAGTVPLASVRAQLGAALDIIVHMGRLSDQRRVLSIEEVIGCEDEKIRLAPLYEAEEGGRLVRRGELYHKEKLHKPKAQIPGFRG